MSGQPKNKITRVERGKRRAGNTPKLVKDTAVSKIPLHKRDFFSRMLAKLGAKSSTKTADKSAKKNKKVTKQSVSNPATQNIVPLASSAPVKHVRTTQNKGGG